MLVTTSTLSQLHHAILQDASELAAWGAGASDFVVELEDAPSSHGPSSNVQSLPAAAGLDILEGLAAM